MAPIGRCLLLHITRYASERSLWARLLTGGLEVRVLPEEPLFSTTCVDR